MDDIESKLMQEYIESYKYYMYWQLKMAGFGRFDIKNGRIVKLGPKSKFYNTLVLTISNCVICFLLYTSIYNVSYLKIPDGICIIHFATYANLLILNLTYVHPSSGADLIDHCIKVDIFFGYKDTQFLRDVGQKTFRWLTILIVIFNFIVGIFLYFAYEVSQVIHFFGSSYFAWLFFAYNDYAVFTLISVFTSMRLQYLNVALLKRGNMKEKYLPSGSLINMLFWNKKFNHLVRFQDRSMADFIKAFRMLFNIARLLEKYYQFALSLGVWTIVMGTFVAVQTFIMRLKDSVLMNTEAENKRTILILGWAGLSWVFIAQVIILTDMLPEQLNQMKFICSYIRLKPRQTDQTYKLLKALLQTADNTNPQFSVYNIYYFSKKLLFNMAASTLIYITAQLQLAFSDLPVSKSNGTRVDNNYCLSL